MNVEQQTQSHEKQLLIALLFALLLHTWLLMIFFDRQAPAKKIEQPLVAVQEILDLPTQRSGQGIFGPDQKQQEAEVIFYDIPAKQEAATPHPAQAQKPQPVPPIVPKQTAAQPTEFIEIKQPMAKVEKKHTIKPSPPIHPASPAIPPAHPERVQASRRKGQVNPFVRPFKARAMLQKIGKGFLEHIKDHGGDDAMDIEGSNRPASLRDVKYISYLQKVYWALQNAFKSDRSTVTLTYDERIVSTIKMVIDQAGEIVDLKVANPPVNRSVDQLIRTIMYRAAPFPPMPKHFDRKTFTHSLRLEIKLPRGTHQPNWVCY